MEEAYIVAKKLVTEKYGRNYKYFSLVTLALSAIIYKYMDHIDDIVNLFNKTVLYLDKDSLNNIVKKNKINNIDYSDEEEKLNNNNYVSSQAFSYSGYSGMISNNEFQPIIENPIIIADTRGNKTLILNNLIHEFNHLVKNIVNGYEILENDEVGFAVRSGIDIFKWIFDFDTYTTYEITCFSLLDETINVFETTEMTESLLMLDGIIPDEDVKYHFDSLDKELMQEDIGYELLAEELRPLWNNEEFRNLIEDNIYEGNIDNIISKFEDIMGVGSFERFTDLLDDYDEEIMNNGFSKKRKKIKEKIKTMVKRYNNLTNFVYKK